MGLPQSVADPSDQWSAAADEPLVLAAIGRSDDTWLSAEAVAAEAGVPVERVRTILDHSSAVIVDAEVEPGSPPRYSTRAHYRARTGLMRRYLDALLTS
jgi:hypothetical protein